MQRLKIEIKKGLDIPIAGQPQQVVDSGSPVNQVALLSPDYVGLKPMILVQCGQSVRLGEPLFVDKRDPAVQFTAPGSGRIVAINRARRRKLQSVVIELDSTVTATPFLDPRQANDPMKVRDILLRSGLWTSFRTRPYNRVPNSASSPHSIFVTAIDTRPLSPDPEIIIARRENEFSKGMAIIQGLGDWPLYLCTGPNWTGPEFDGDGIRHVEFSGPHPAGLAGTHIHYLDPVAADREVWHIGYQDVIALGHLFETGYLFTERVVSIAGVGALKPRLLSTRTGANVMELVQREIVMDIDHRIISGSVLDGHAVKGPLGYLGRYHNQVSIIPDAAQRRLFGWLPLFAKHNSTTWPSSPTSKEKPHYHVTTARNGRRTAMIPVEAFDRVMPLDILPTPLLRAILVKDTDAAQALGCLELVEEDLALTSFVCPAKQNYGIALRLNLDQIEQEG